MTSFFRSGVVEDRLYALFRDGAEDHHVRGRDYLESIWRECSRHLDADCVDKASRDFVSVYWELQLAYALKRAGKQLADRDKLNYRRNKGPDLFVRKPNVWLEAVVVRSGTGPDALESYEMGKVYKYETDPVVLRLRSVIQDKSLKISSYIADGIVKTGEATIIAISGVLLPHRFSGRFPSEIVRAVYPVDNPTVDINRITGAAGEPYLEYRDRIKKKMGAEVATDIFLDPGFAHISAVLYGEADWVHPIKDGEDFNVVHNPIAKNPLPDGWFPKGHEYWLREGMRLDSKDNNET